MEQITLKELLDKTLSLSDEEWADLSKPTQEKILKLIDPENLIPVPRRKPDKVELTEEKKEILNFIRMDKNEINEMKSWKREKLLLKATELAQAANKVA